MNLWVALGHVLPIAVALALSTVPIMATILILLSENKRRSSVPYLIGWVIGIAFVATACTLLAAVIPTSSPNGKQLTTGFGQMLVGLALVALAIIMWRRARAKPKGDEPKWFSAVGSFGPWTSFGIGFVLNLRPKSILLGAATGLALRGDGLSIAGTSIVIGVYTVLAATTVAVPIAATLISPAKSEPTLLRTRTMLAANSRYISIVIMLMIGVVIVGNGLTHL
jgi:hypothetical protein